MTAFRLRFALLAACLCAASLSAQSPGWTPLGPWGGTVTSLAVHPKTPGVLYAAGGLPGVLKSTDAGASWQRLPGSPGPSFVVLDPTRPTTLYAPSTFYPSEIFKSTDGGAHWSLIDRGLPRETPIPALAVDPARPSRLYAVAQGRGIWRSVNGGASWQAANQGLSGGASASVNVLAVPRRPAGTAFAGTGFGLFRTRNGGASWEPLRKGLPARAVVALALAPSDPRTVYASLMNQGIYRSTDGGDSWSLAGNPERVNLLVTTLAVHPRSPRTVYGGNTGAGLFKSTDGGAHWTPTAPPPTKSVLTVALDSAAALYVGTPVFSSDPGGVLRSADGGASWERRNRGIPGLVALSVAIDPTDPDNLIAATGGQGLFRTANRGARWARTPLGFPAVSFYGALTSEPVSTADGTFYAVAGEGGRIWKSSDAGLTWVPLAGPGGLVRFLRADPLDPNRLYALVFVGISRVFYRSGDGGASWTSLSTPPATCELDDLAVAPSAPAVLYLVGSQPPATGPVDACGTPGDRPAVFRSTDGGASWTAADTGLAGHVAAAVAVDPVDAQAVYVGLGSRPGTPPPGVWKSTDGGGHWEPAGSRLQGQHISALLASPVPGRVYAAGLNGRIYRSSDAGGSWQEWSQGLSTFQVYRLVLDPDDPRRVYAATNTGIWVREED